MVALKWDKKKRVESFSFFYVSTLIIREPSNKIINLKCMPILNSKIIPET